MEIFILIALAFITIFVLVGISFVILRKRSPFSHKRETPDKKNALLDDEEPLHHYDPSYLGSPLYKIRKSKND